MFYPTELNVIWYKKHDKYYKIFLAPYYCTCSYFIDLHYVNKRNRPQKVSGK